MRSIYPESKADMILRQAALQLEPEQALIVYSDILMKLAVLKYGGFLKDEVELSIDTNSPWGIELQKLLEKYNIQSR